MTMQTPSCPLWCTTDHTVDELDLHWSELRGLPAIERNPDGLHAGDFTVAGHREDDTPHETWVTIASDHSDQRLEITAESAHRLIYVLQCLLAEVSRHL